MKHRGSISAPLAIKLGAASVLIVLVLLVHYRGVKKAVTAEHNKMQMVWDADRDRTRTAALVEATKNAQITEQRVTEQKEAANAAEKRATQSRLDATRSADAVARLRYALATATASGGNVPPDPTAPPNGEISAQIGNVLAACATEYREMGIDAEDDRSRGLEANADYDAVVR